MHGILVFERKHKGHIPVRDCRKANRCSAVRSVHWPYSYLCASSTGFNSGEGCCFVTMILREAPFRLLSHRWSIVCMDAVDVHWNGISVFTLWQKGHRFCLLFSMFLLPVSYFFFWWLQSNVMQMNTPVMWCLKHVIPPNHVNLHTTWLCMYANLFDQSRFCSVTENREGRGGGPVALAGYLLCSLELVHSRAAASVPRHSLWSFKELAWLNAGAAASSTALWVVISW